MRTRRELVLVVLIAALLAVGPMWSPVRAEAGPLRSGTIVGGAGVEFGGGQPRPERSGCEYALDCLAWLRSGCDPALAGHDPVVTASIVDVADLADDSKRRSLRMSAPSVPPWGLYPGVVVQFWRADCSEIPGSKVHSLGSTSPCQGWGLGPCELVIPTDARWMTLSGYVTTAGLTWKLS